MLQTSRPVVFPVLLVAGLLVFRSSVSALTNSWTSLVTGNWHDLSWSAGSLPQMTDGAVAITNHGSKAVIIGAVTAESYSTSLQIQNLLLSCPPGWTNTLLLNYLSWRPPLEIAGTGWVGTNGVFLNLYSNLRFTGTNESAGLVLDGGSFIQEGGSTHIANELRVGDSAHGFMAITNGILSARDFIVGHASGEVLQEGGEVSAEFLDIGHRDGTYRFSSGNLVTEYLRLGERNAPWDLSASGTFYQTGGTNRSEWVSIAHSGSWAKYELQDGLAVFGQLTVSQSGTGTLLITGGRMEVGSMTVSNNDRETGYVDLEGGELVTDSVTVGYSGDGFFRQTGGIHRAGELRVSGDDYRWVGSYSLDDGLLEANNIDLTTGVMSQLGGTNHVAGAVVVGGRGSGYFMEDGLLTAGTLAVTRGGTFKSVYTQEGGRVELSGSFSVGGEANLDGGVIIAPAVWIGAEAVLNVAGGALLGNEQFTFADGRFFFKATEMHLGTLRVLDEFYGDSQFAFPSTNSVLSFADSRGQSWDTEAILRIYGWDGNAEGNGRHQLRVGSGGPGLTGYQLARIRFEDPAGFPSGTYHAVQLPTGEVVPTDRAYLATAQAENNLVFNWPAGWHLETASVVEGPYEPVAGAQSPHTNVLSGSDQFFRLRRDAGF